MPRTIECPRCKGRFDASDLQPGARIPCGACGQIVQIPAPKQVPVPQAAPAPAPAPQPEAEPDPPSRNVTRRRTRGSATRIRRGGAVRGGGSRSGSRLPAVRKSSNTGLVLGLSLGGLALVIAIVVMVRAGATPPPAPTDPSNPAAAPGAAPVIANPMMPAPVPPPTPAPAPPDAPDPDTPKPITVSRDPDKANWDKLMRMLRPGGGFDDPNRPEGVAFSAVKSMGKGAYPHLVKYISDPDIQLARAAVVVLNELTGRNSKLPNEATRDAVKADWQKWVSENP